MDKFRTARLIVKLYDEFTNDIIKNNYNYDDNDFTLDSFVFWLKHKIKNDWMKGSRNEKRDNVKSNGRRA